MKHKNKTEELFPSRGDQGDGTDECRARTWIESCAETFSFSLKDTSEIMSRMNKICQLDNSIVDIFNFHIWQFCGAYVRECSCFGEIH